MTKSRHVTFRCTEEQYKTIKRDAGYCGVSVSEHILETYFDQYPMVSKPPMSEDEKNQLATDRLKAIKQNLNPRYSIKDKP